MNRKLFIVAAILLIILPAAMPGQAQENMQVVDISVFPAPRRPPALFAHDGHNEKARIDDCGVCHHAYENGRRSEVETSEDMACVECHSLKAGQNKYSLRRAFHLRCKGCHLARNAGPVMCAECHPRPLEAARR